EISAAMNARTAEQKKANVFPIGSHSPKISATSLREVSDRLLAR
ncbi:MAG: hypothetical protein ACI97A_003201, partial [Planctomycetota bacterium]